MVGKYEGEISQVLVAEMVQEIRQQVNGLVNELNEVKRVFNAHTHEVTVGLRGITTADIEGDDGLGMTADDQFYGLPQDHKSAVLRRRDFEIAIKALQKIAVFTSDYSAWGAIHIARDVLRLIERDLPKSEGGKSENDGMV